jgi:hypothetical protein
MAATLQHLQALQTPKALLHVPRSPRRDAHGNASLEIRPYDLFGDLLGDSSSPTCADDSDKERLRETLRSAEFWISLLEGERHELMGEGGRQKAHLAQLEQRLDDQSGALRELEGEKKRLTQEVKWLQQSRDDNMIQKSLLREGNTKAKGDVDNVAARAEALEAEIQKEHETNKRLEELLVRFKMRHVEVLQAVDSLEVITTNYEEQLKAFNPKFATMDREKISLTLKSMKKLATSPDEGAESESASEQEPVKIAKERGRRLSQVISEEQDQDVKTKTGWKVALGAVSKFKKNIQGKQPKPAAESSRDRAAGAAGAAAPQVPALEVPKDADGGGGSAQPTPREDDEAPQRRRKWELRMEE